MRNPLLLVAAIAVLAVPLSGCLEAGAATPSTPEVHNNKETFTNLYVEPKAYCEEGNPALSIVSGGVICAELADCVAKGARTGQACLASVNLGADGGSTGPVNANLSCRCKKDAIVFKWCLQANDAGVLATFDAGYTGRCIN